MGAAAHAGGAFQHVKGNDIEQFKGTDKVVVVSPAEYKSCELLSFEDARR